MIGGCQVKQILSLMTINSSPPPTINYSNNKSKHDVLSLEDLIPVSNLSILSSVLRHLF